MNNLIESDNGKHFSSPYFENKDPELTQLQIERINELEEELNYINSSDIFKKQYSDRINQINQLIKEIHEE